MAGLRWAWVEVDLGAVAHNVRELKSKTAAGCAFLAVVKADGYGHGAVQVSNAALSAGAERLGVATVEEGVALREAGITAPVHLLSEPPPEAAGVVIRHRLLPTVCSLPFAAALSAAAQEAQTVAEYHLKVDTGMNRIGARFEDAAEFADSLRSLASIRLTGTFTHFATAEVPGDWEFERQVERFESLLDEMRTLGIDPGTVHAANSAATILQPQTHYDMVRCGIAVYGLHPDESTRDSADLRPVMSVKARVSQAKRIGMGEGVSYGFDWHAAKPTTVATLPLGYADGVRRGVSGLMRVVIDGRECRQIGRVTMDQIMVEVPDSLRVTAGDEAVVVGTQSGVAVTMDEQADAAGTITYEIACGYGMRLERRFLAGG